MKHQKTALVIATLTLASTVLALPVVSYDFEDQPYFDSVWIAGFEQTVGDYTLQGVGAEIDAMKRPVGDQLAWQGGFAFLYGMGPGSSGTMTLDNGVGQTLFKLQSIDLGSAGGSTLTGTLGGVVQWTIVAAFTDSSSPATYLQTYTAATTGDLSLMIDSMEWVNVSGGWEERLDNVQLEAIPEPSTVAFAGLSGVGLLLSRRLKQRKTVKGMLILSRFMLVGKGSSQKSYNDRF